MTRVAALLALAAASHAATFSSSYRKDAYLPQYLELNNPVPLVGGRVHVVGLASASGVPSSIILNGTLLDLSATQPEADWLVDWARVEPLNGLAAGAPFWLSFHSRRAAWDALAADAGVAPVPLAILDAAGATLAAGSFAPRVPDVPCTYLTTADNRSTVHAFLRAERGTGDAVLSRLSINGVDVTAVVPTAQLTVPENETVLFVLPASAVGGAAAVAPGAVWTLEATWGGARAPTAAGGLLFAEFYPVETWYHGPDCPFPGMNDTAYALHRAHGVDTFFAEYTFDAACNTKLTSADVVNVLAPLHDFYVLPSAEDARFLAQVNDTSRLAGLFLADEDDGPKFEAARELLAAVVRARTAFPGVPTYAGGASNRNTGLYAGVTDVKGM